MFYSYQIISFSRGVAVYDYFINPIYMPNNNSVAGAVLFPQVEDQERMLSQQSGQLKQLYEDKIHSERLVENFQKYVADLEGRVSVIH